MLFNYFRTWFRNVIKYRTYAAINLLGLGIGIACCYLCVLYLLYDWSFDRFHQDYHRIYRVSGKIMFDKRIGGPKAGTWTDKIHFPVPLASAILAETPEIETATSVKDIKSFPPTNKAMWRVGIHENFLRDIEDVIFVDSNSVEIFSFPIISGTFPSTSGQVVITRAFAQTLTNDISSLVGKTLWMQPPERPFSGNQQSAVSVEIGGIVETPPHNSSLTFEILVPFTMYSTFRTKRKREWDWAFTANHYIRLSEESPINVVEKKISQVIQKRSAWMSIWDVSTFEAKLQPITDLHHIVKGIGGDGVRPGTNSDIWLHSQRYGYSGPVCRVSELRAALRSAIQFAYQRTGHKTNLWREPTATPIPVIGRVPWIQHFGLRHRPGSRRIGIRSP